MNKKVKDVFALSLLGLSPLLAGELEDYRLIRSAYDDQLYLFVEDKARAFLSNEDYDQSGTIARDVRSYWIAGLIERGAFSEALERIKAMPEVEGPRWIYLKARALYGAMVEQGMALPEGESRPSTLLKGVIPKLRGDDQLMGRYVMGQDLFDIGDYAQASLVLKSLVEGERGFRFLEDAKFLYGRSLYYLPHPLYEDALYTFRELSQKYTRSSLLPRYHFWRAQCFFELNQLGKAEMAFGAALGASPDPSTVVDVRYNLGWLYVAMGDLERATQSLEAVLKAPLEYSERYLPSARYKMASIYMLDGQPEKCLSILKPVLKDPGLEFEAALLSAQAALALKDLVNAEVLLQKAQRSPQKEIQLEAGRLLGRVYLDLEDFKHAEEILLSLINKSVPLDFRVDVQLQLADVYFAKGDIYHSQEIYRQLLAEKNKKIEASLHYNLALCAMKSNPLVEGLFLRDRLLEKKGDLSEDEYEVEKLEIEAKVEQELAKVWLLASREAVGALSKKAVMKQLELLTGQNRWALVREMEDKALAAGLKIPSPLGLDLVMSMTEGEAEKGLAEFWDLLRDEASMLYKQAVMNQLESLTGQDREAMISELKQEALEDGTKIPSPTGMDTVMFNKLVAFFKEALWKEGQVPPYTQAEKVLGVLNQNLGSLQVTTISAHLDHVINMGQKNPYLALAYFEKAMLFKQQSLSGDAVEALQYAIANSTDPDLQAKYLLEVSRVEIDMAQATNDDPKTVKVRLNRALEHLMRAEVLLEGRPLGLVDLLYTAYRLLLDNENAEKVLVDFLATAKELEEIQAVEERLISFYLQRQRPIMAAQRRLVYAESLEKHDKLVEAQKQRYDAATVLLESKQGHEEGVKWLVELSQALPASEWTFKAGLQRVSIFQRASENEKAEELLKALEEGSKDLDLHLQLEVQMAKGDHALRVGDLARAGEAFKVVMDKAGDQVSLKARAMIEYSKTLKRSQPSLAADVLLQFYYLFPKDEKREEVLYESCRLQIVALKGIEEKLRKARKAEILRLISKLEQARDRQKLSAYLEGV